MNTARFVNVETALELKQKGFDEMCEYIFANHYRVRDEIHEKYPGLSDDGYRELTVDWGGTLQEDEVYATYVEPIKECFRNYWIGPDVEWRICTMPTLDDARTWLRNNHKIHIVIVPTGNHYKADVILSNEFGVIGYGSSHIQVYNPDVHPSAENSKSFATYEAALAAGIREALHYVKNGEGE